MAYYSLVASLPSLQIGDEPPVTVEQYIENCAQWVTERETGILKAVLQNEPTASPCPLCKAWHNMETQLRNTVAKFRGQKLGIDFKEYLQPHFIDDLKKLVQLFPDSRQKEIINSWMQ